MPLFVEGKRVDPSVDTVQQFLKKYENLRNHSIKYTLADPRELTKNDKILYVNQREYATVASTDQHLRFVGSDDATTCHLLVIQDETVGISSLGHFDGSDSENGLKGILAEIKCLQKNSSVNGGNLVTEKHLSPDKLTQYSESAVLKVHIFGGFCDDKHYSEELFQKLIELLDKVEDVTLEMATVCVFSVNNFFDGRFNRPIIYGIGVNTRTGEIFSARFKYKGPDEPLRHARIFGSSSSMLSIYDFETGCMKLGPFDYRPFPEIRIFLQFGDNEILKFLSTSPHCEPPDFVSTTRKALTWLLQHPEPAKTLFMNGKARLYRLNDNGEWIVL